MVSKLTIFEIHLDDVPFSATDPSSEDARDDDVSAPAEHSRVSENQSQSVAVLFVGALLVLLVGVLAIRRRRKATSTADTGTESPSESDEADEYLTEERTVGAIG